MHIAAFFGYGALATRDSGTSTVVPAYSQTALQCFYGALPIDLFLCGVLTMMLLSYYEYNLKESKDNWWTQLVVGAVAVVSYVFSGYLVFFVYQVLVADFGNYDQFIIRDFKYSFWFALLDGITSGLTQGFFTYRAFKITGRNYILLGTLVFLIVTSFAGALSLAVINTTNLSSPNAMLTKPSAFVWLVTSMAADIIITTAILYALITSRTGWAHTDKILLRLSRVTAESQMFPTFIAIAMVVQYAVSANSAVAVLFQGILPKLYCLGLVYSLNSRYRLMPTHPHPLVDTYGVSGQTTRTHATGIKVDIQTETYETRSNITKQRIEPHVPKAAKIHESSLEGDDWDDAEANTETIYDSLKSSAKESITSKVRLVPATPPPATPSASVKGARVGGGNGAETPPIPAGNDNLAPNAI